MQDHRKLESWNRSCSLAVRGAAELFPKRGYAELKQQMISAAESMAHTIVEGCGADTQKEFARYLGLSIKSNRSSRASSRWRDGVAFYQTTIVAF